MNACIKPQGIYAIGLASAFPEFGAGEATRSSQADTKAGIPSCRPAEERQGHRYLLLVDYTGQLCSAGKVAISREVAEFLARLKVVYRQR